MDTELITLESLAPGAGAGIGKEIAKTLLAREGFIQRMADALDNALTATRRTWDSGAKQWVEEPDTRSQLQACFGVLAHMEGEPIKRVIHEVRKSIDASEALSSPAAIEAAERMIAGAKAKLRRAGVKTGPKRAEPVEADGPAGKF